MKTLDEMIAVMEASKTKKIQRKHITGLVWYDCTDDFSWDWSYYDYRVKPEPSAPRKVWINWRSNGIALTAYILKDDARKFGWESIDGCLEFIELTPEVRQKLGIT